jgi:hypothetical protein
MMMHPSSSVAGCQTTFLSRQFHSVWKRARFYKRIFCCYWRKNLSKTHWVWIVATNTMEPCPNVPIWELSGLTKVEFGKSHSDAKLTYPSSQAFVTESKGTNGTDSGPIPTSLTFSAVGESSIGVIDGFCRFSVSLSLSLSLALSLSLSLSNLL